jgi:hypothetical protein
MVLDPMGIRNFALDDGDPMLSWEEYQLMRISWEFVRFYTADIRAARARSDYIFGQHEMSALDEGFPLLTGQLYRDLMDLWFLAPERRDFADAHARPGFQHLLAMWDDGNFWGLWNNAFPLMSIQGASVIDSATEWNSRATVGGIRVNQAGWLPNVIARLPDWNESTNARFASRFANIDARIEMYYTPQAQRLSD